MPSLELYGTAGCPYTREMREWRECKGKDFEVYDIDADPQARARIQSLARAPYNVPLLVEDGKVVQVGWQGRSCLVNAG